MNPMISYESIRTVHRAEKEEGLAKLPDGFFRAVQQWLSHKRSRGDTNSLLEAESAKKLLEDIVNRRQRKIIFAALASARGSAPPQNMTLEEARFFDRLLVLLKEQQNKAKERLFGADFLIEQKMEEARQSVEEMKESAAEKPKEEEPPEPEHVETTEEKPLKPLNSTKKVKILIELPRFVDKGGNHYGPFKAGETADIPEDVFKLLSMRRAAEPIEE